MDNLIRHDLGNGINLYIIPSSKFKAISIRLFMHQELNENASKTALLPLVLRRGCKGYDTQRKIRIYLDELFGAFFEVGVQKKGERHVMVFGMSIPNEQYIGQENSTLAKAIQFLNRIVMDPVTENGVFLQKYVEQEKVNLTQIIQSLINDKAQYAIERCLQIMCQNERFSHYTYGDLQSLKDITTTNLYDHYERSIASSPIDIFVAGDVSEDQVGSVTEEMIKLTREKIQIIPEEIIKKATGKVKEVVEEMNVLQGKLVMGYRTNTSYTDRLYFPLVVFSAILGGGPHSKLFINLREKAQLAYYSYARLEKFKGLMLISAGIDSENYHRTLDIIAKQIVDIRKGEISQTEYERAVKYLTASLMASNDSQEQLIDFHMGNVIKNMNISISSFIERIEKVTLDQIINVSHRIKLDTIYFLRKKRKGSGIRGKSH
ncbi:MAG: EF-P 5-aminopentanol modification-associated protein YfmF [Clostridia bacterium]